jgi:hypothetical protein
MRTLRMETRVFFEHVVPRALAPSENGSPQYSVMFIRNIMSPERSSFSAYAPDNILAHTE